jgi:hypothetical protein
MKALAARRIRVKMGATSSRVAFVGIDRGMQRKFRTRKNMAKLIGISYDDFVEWFGWENLYGDETRDVRPAAENRTQAAQLRGSLAKYERVVLLGDEVAEAFGVDDQSKYVWFELAGTALQAARMIHTSQRHFHLPARQQEIWTQARPFARSLLRYI